MEHPTLSEWMELSQQEIAEIVRPHHVTVLIDNDGTQRYYRISRLRKGETSSLRVFENYAIFTAHAYVQAFNMLYSLGVETIVSPIMFWLHFERGEEYIRKLSETTEEFLASDIFGGLYRKWQVIARIYGSYDIAPAAESIRDQINRTAQRLEEQTPAGERRLLYAYDALPYTEEIIIRTAALQQALGYTPSPEELRRACFPPGLEQVDILITSGPLRAGHLLHPLLDDGKTDLYSLAYLLMEIRERTIRRILYDHLFLRRTTVDRMTDTYGPDDLQLLDDYYKTHLGAVAGLGYTVGPGLWYPYHIKDDECID